MPSGLSQKGQQAEDDGPLGSRLRSRRRELNLTLKDVADGAGLSVGFISQVERGLTSPSLSSLVSISGVLKTHVTTFLSQPEGKSPLTRRRERSTYRVDRNAVQYERLSAAFPGSVLNGLIIHEPPGHRSEPIRHDGEELFFVLDGAITVEVDGESKLLEVGDSIHFASTRRHSSWNHTTAPATILHICTLDVFGERPADEPASGHYTEEPQAPIAAAVAMATNEPNKS